ncbi:MAG: response regulator, partial [Clostridiales bacterium]|nr:response regulator [Clostridiales bacterium]
FEDIEEEARAAGIDLFMSKPFFVSNFKRAVKEIRNDGAAAEVNPEPENASLKGLKVLAAEDNEINAEILTELLDIEEVTCEIAFNGKEAVEKFEASKVGQYDLIFMDIQMPIMNGYEAARAIRASKHKRAKTIPIIAMTANAFDDDVKAALDAGMNAHLAKPIDMDKLKQLVIKILDENKGAK